MRQSDQNSSSNLTLNTATALGAIGSTSQRRYAGHKISKVRFLADQAEFTGRFVSGTWNTPPTAQGYLTLWQVNDGKHGSRNGEEKQNGEKGCFQRKSRLGVGNGTDVNDIFIINAQQFVASMSNGDVKIVDCSIPDGSNAANESIDSAMSIMATYPHVHKPKMASTALCVLENEVFSGSDSGQIVRIQPATRSSHAVRTFAEDLMGVTGLCTCGQFLMVSAHTTGQLHLWDIRKRALSPEFGNEPLHSRPVTALNNSITALAPHPSQHNVIAFGTQNGVVSFVDIRQNNQPLPIAFKVAQEPIREIKFHPIFANNCFSLSNSGIIHWDGSVLARELNPTIFSGSATNGTVADELMAATMEMDDPAEGNEHPNIWLSARTSSMQLRVLVEEEPRLLSSFDIAQGAMVAGSHTAELLLMNGMNFSN